MSDNKTNKPAAPAANTTPKADEAKKSTKPRETRLLSIVYKTKEDGTIDVITATRNGNKIVDAITSDRDAKVIRVKVDE